MNALLTVYWVQTKETFMPSKFALCALHWHYFSSTFFCWVQIIRVLIINYHNVSPKIFQKMPYLLTVGSSCGQSDCLYACTFVSKLCQCQPFQEAMTHCNMPWITETSPPKTVIYAWWCMDIVYVITDNAWTVEYACFVCIHFTTICAVIVINIT